MRILLICNAGMSTSMLLTSMERSAKERNIDATIMAVSFNESLDIVHTFDIAMLGPQDRHQANRLRDVAGDVPIVIISMKDYGQMNGEKVLDDAINEIKK